MKLYASGRQSFLQLIIIPIFIFNQAQHAHLKDFLLFIDTETSGVPQRWDRPYADTQNWPSVIQVAWIICDSVGREIKRSSMYIFEKDIEITKESQRVHGINAEFLQQHGRRRKDVLRKLAYDVAKYPAVIIGHFIELDIHVLSSDYYRAQLKNPFINQTFFCTMLDSKKYAINPAVDYLRLPQLYEFLFDRTPEETHEAEQDAQLTAQCYLELRSRGAITIADLVKQQATLSKKLNIQDKQNP